MASNVEVENKKLTNKLEQKVLRGKREIKNNHQTHPTQIVLFRSSKVLCQKDDYTVNRVWGFKSAKKSITKKKKNEVKNKNKIIRNESRKTFLISLWRQ